MSETLTGKVSSVLLTPTPHSSIADPFLTTNQADDVAGKASPQESKGVFQSMKDTVMGNEGLYEPRTNALSVARV